MPCAELGCTTHLGYFLGWSINRWLSCWQYRGRNTHTVIRPAQGGVCRGRNITLISGKGTATHESLSITARAGSRLTFRRRQIFPGLVAKRYWAYRCIKCGALLVHDYPCFAT